MMKHMLLAVALLLLPACTTAQVNESFQAGHLAPSVIVDDQAGIAVETAYQAATLAVRTAVKAGFVSPSQARTLLAYDTRAYREVCKTRTAYDVVNGKDPAARKDGCPADTKTGAILGYASAASLALGTIRDLVTVLRSYRVAAGASPPPVPAKVNINLHTARIA
jgi:hypothetical protein